MNSRNSKCLKYSQTKSNSFKITYTLNGYVFKYSVNRDLWAWHYKVSRT